jgi:hypothetical protein
MSQWESSILFLVIGLLVGWGVSAACYLWELVKTEHDERLFLLGRNEQENPRLRLFCADDHEWFGEILPAVCPCCHRAAIGARL